MTRTDGVFACAARRLGRIGIGILAFAVGCVAFVVTSIISVAVTKAWSVDYCGIAAFFAAIGTFGVLDHLGLVPDDADPPTTLSLRPDGRTDGGDHRHFPR